MAELYIGCSGFSYHHWRGTFYPEDIPVKQWFNYYSKQFSTVELNVTFYRTPTAQNFQHWFEESAADFSFSVKGSRYITHIKRLQGIEEALDRFFTPASELKDKLKVVLWQFPPHFKYDPQRLQSFLGLLENYQVRNTLEFRNESWICDEVVAMCKAKNISLCMADSPPYLNELPVTSDFVYIRRHGMQGSYNGSYSREELQKDAARIERYLERNLDVFIYFNNDIGGAAPNNAIELSEMLQKYSER